MTVQSFVISLVVLALPMAAWSNDSLLVELIQPRTALNQAWLARADEAVKQASPSDPAPSMAVLRGITTNFRNVFLMSLKNEQVLFFKEFFAGMMSASQAGENNWPTHLARETVAQAIFRLYSAEYQLHLAVNDNEGSIYLPGGALRDLNFNCAAEARTLPASLQAEFGRQCDRYQQIAVEQNRKPRVQFDELSRSAEEKLGVMLKKRDELKAREQLIGAQLGRLATTRDLLADAEYAQGLLELRSCQATFFDGSQSLSPMLRRTQQFRDYLEDYRAQRVQPLLPARTPVARFLHEMNGRVANRDGSSLTSTQATVHLARFLLSAKHDLIQQTIELRRYLIGEYLALHQEARTGQEATERSIKWMAHFPLVAGASVARVDVLNRKVWPHVLAASTYFSDRNETFGNRMFYTGLMSLGTLFIPGPNVAIGMGMTFRAGTLLYAALVATQMGLIAEQMNEMAGNHYVANREEILSLGSPLAQMKSEEIARGLFDGALNAGFLMTGETFAAVQLGKNTLSAQLHNFVSWVRSKRGVLLKRRAAQNHVIPILTAIKDDGIPVLRDAIASLGEIKKLKVTTPEGAQALEEVTKAFEQRASARVAELNAGIDAALPLSPQGWTRARSLLQAMEADLSYQQLLIETVRKISNETHRRIFLEILIEKAVLRAEIGGGFFMSRYGFLKAARDQVHDLYNAYAVNSRFKGELLSYISVTPHPLAAPAEQMRKVLREIPEMLADRAKLALARSEKPELAALVERLMASKLQQVRRQLETRIQKSLRPVEDILKKRDLRNAPYAFTRKFVDDIKRSSLDLVDRLMADPEVSKLFFAGALDIDVPGYSIRQAQFYIERAVAITEIIDDQVIRLTTQSGVSYSNIRESVMHALKEINQAPADFALKMVEMTGLVSRLLVANNLTSEQRASFATQAARFQPLNCSLDAVSSEGQGPR